MGEQDLFIKDKMSYNEGCMEAYYFAKEQDADIEQIKAEIQTLQSNNTSTHDSYQAGFLAGLIRALEIIGKDATDYSSKKFSPSTTYPTRLHFILGMEAIRYAGRLDAFTYALKVKGRIKKIEEEIEQTEELIASGIGSSAPGTSTRIYRDGYLEGLKEALEIVRNETKRT